MSAKQLESELRPRFDAFVAVARARREPPALLDAARVTAWLRAQYPELARRAGLARAVERALPRYLAAHPALAAAADAAAADAPPAPEPRPTALGATLRLAYAEQSAAAQRKRKRGAAAAAQSAAQSASATSAARRAFGAAGVEASAPAERFAELGGLESVLQDIEELVRYPLEHPEVYAHLGVDTPCGILLHGPPGCGKTMLARAIAGEFNLPFFSVAAPEIVSGMSGESEAKLRDLFAKAQAVAPSIIFIDEIDAISPKRENAQREMERRIVAQLLSSMDALHQRSSAGPEADGAAASGGGGATSGAAAVDAASGSTEGVVDLTSDGGSSALPQRSPMVLVIGATNRADAIDSALRRAGRFDREIAVPIPDEKARASILRLFSRNLRLDASVDIDALARLTPGYVGADLKALTREAAVAAINRVFATLGDKMPMSESEALAAITVGDSDEDGDDKADGNSADEPPSTQPMATDATASTSAKAAPQTARARDAAQLVTRRETSKRLRLRAEPFTPSELEPLAIETADFEVALHRVQPSARREGFAVKPDVSWSDVGALEEVRSELEMALVQPIRHPERFEQLGIATPAGVLLYGAPGNGKTLLAKAIANQAGANFISIKGPELLDKYVGESEKAVRQVFARARAAAPCIIFFDELDALCARRGGDGTNQAGERVVNQLLTEMDGVSERKQIYVVGATNRPDMIDAAMLRPGRLDKLLYVPMPDAAGRASILKAVARRTPLHEDVDLDKLGNDPRTHGFSGADLASLVREAAVAALREAFASDVTADAANNGTEAVANESDRAESDNEKSDKAESYTPLLVAMRHFERALLKVQPSVSQADERLYDHLRQRLRKRRVPRKAAEADDAAAASGEASGGESAPSKPSE